MHSVQMDSFFVGQPTFRRVLRTVAGTPPALDGQPACGFTFPVGRRRGYQGINLATFNVFLMDRELHQSETGRPNREMP